MLGCTDRQLGDKIKRPKVRERKIECFSIREQRKIENAVLTSRKHKYFGVLLCLYTGLRIGEVVALKWNDIDLKKGMLSVNKTCYVNPTSSYRKKASPFRYAPFNEVSNCFSKDIV